MQELFKIITGKNDTQQWPGITLLQKQPKEMWRAQFLWNVNVLQTVQVSSLV
jgi:hypothetical protein